MYFFVRNYLMKTNEQANLFKELLGLMNYSHIFFCLSPGEYELSIKFNDEHIPDSPFIVPMATLSDDARRLTLTSLQVRGQLFQQ